MLRRLLVVAAVLAVAATVVVVYVVRHVDGPAALTGNPFADHPQYDAPDPALVSAAKQAAADGDGHASAQLTRLDGVPTGIWLTPERYPTPEAVESYVMSVVADATSAQRVPVFVVYGIPDRDCTDGQSAGGLSAEAYVPWVKAIAAGAGDTSVAVLEPDALAAATQCDDVDQRVSLLGQAVTALHDRGVVTYIDAGHSSWVSAAEVAPLLEEVGVGSVRGFSTNVSNYQPTSDETSYAEQLSGLLGGAHYIVDTGRNGIGAGAVTDWCNPAGQALGQTPGYVDDGTGLDGYVWVKPPGESDGTCNGGPAAGQLWPLRAEQLATAAGW